MAIKITEDGTVRYVNENDVDRTMFPNLTGAMGDEQYDALNGRLTVVEGKVSDLEECCGDVNTDICQIKNDLNQKADKTDALSAYVTETATGSIASFTDGADDVPVKDLTVAIEPVQDLHGYDNPWPAGGGVNTIDSSKFVSYGTAYGLTTSVDGDWVIISGTYTASSTNANYRILNMSDGSEFPANMKCFPDSASASHFTNNSLGRADGNHTLTIYLINMVTDTVYNLRFRIMGYEGSTAPDSYSPYSNICPISGWTGANVYHSGEDTSDYDTLSISWQTEAGTVYGGTLDVTTGVLTVTMVEVDISTLDYTPSTLASHVFRTDSLQGLIEPPLTNAQTANAICSSFSQIGYSPISASSNGKFAVANKGDSVEGRLIFVDHRYSTIEAFISGNEGTQLVYELDTPQTYQLTSQEVNTILGQNNIFADCGNVTVQYRADTKLYIDKVLST